MMLTNMQAEGYIKSAPAKSGVRFRTLFPKSVKALTQALFLYLRYGGLIQGASARRFSLDGSTNLFKPATLIGFVPDGGSSQLSKEDTTMSSILSFDFSTESVRVVIIDNQPWFVAKDVCAILGIKNHKDAITTLDEDETKGVGITDPLGKNQQTASAVNESGLYALIFKSRKPAAKQFRKWVTNEVLPQIRKTGSYIPDQSVETISTEQYRQLRYQVYLIGNRLQKSGAAEFAAWRGVRKFAGVTKAQLIPSEKYENCLDYLKGIQSDMEAFKECVREAETNIFRRTFKLPLADIKMIEEQAQ